MTLRMTAACLLPRRMPRSIIEGIAKDLQVGDVFIGKVVRIMPFGAFVEYAPGKDGMIHISKLDNKRVEKVEDVVNIGDTLECRVGEIDSQGRINLVRMIPCRSAGRRAAREIVVDAVPAAPVADTGTEENIRDFIKPRLTVCEMGILSMSISHIKELKYDF